MAKFKFTREDLDRMYDEAMAWQPPQMQQPVVNPMQNRQLVQSLMQRARQQPVQGANR